MIQSAQYVLDILIKEEILDYAFNYNTVGLARYFLICLYMTVVVVVVVVFVLFVVVVVVP